MITPPTFDPDNVSLLIVAQSAHVRNLIAALLRGHGITKLRMAESDAEGMEMLRRCDPSVVLTEWDDDGIDGLSLCREIRASVDLSNRAVPVIVVTSKASRADVETARNAGVNEYVIKPVSARSVMSRLTEVLVRPRPFIESPGYVGPCRRRKKNAAYQGPFRRLADPIDNGEIQPEEARNKDIARRAVNLVAASAQALVPGDRGRVRDLFDATQDLASCGQDISDASLLRSARSLLRYINGVGASPKLDPRVVQMHIEAMRRIVDLPNAAREVRDRVAASLETLVSKKLRQDGAETFDDVIDPQAPGVQKISSHRL